MEIKIGKPVKLTMGPRNKYSKFVDQVNALKNDDWLPLECGELVQATSLAQALRHRRLEVAIRGNVVYARKKASK